MADFARYLPLSQRSPDDESAVTSDRKAQLCAVVEEAARLIDIGAPEFRHERVKSFVATARLEREQKRLGTDDLALLALDIRDGRKQSVRVLAHAVRAVLRTAASVGAEPELDTAITGAAALWASGTASLERRAVIQGHTIRATDADWAFGTGPTLEGRSIDIAAFLLAESEQPPQRPATHPSAAPRTLEP